MSASLPIPRFQQLAYIAALLALMAASIAWVVRGPAASAQDATGFSSNQAVVTTDALNLREDASTDGGVIEVLPPGTYGVILDSPVADDNATWYLVQVDTVSGYVAGEYLADAASAGSFAVNDVVYVKTDALNLRDAAALSGAVIATLAPGAAGSVIAGPVDADGHAWYQIDVAGQTGWAARDFLAYGTMADVAAVGGATTATVGSLLVNTDSLNVRAAAGLDSAVLEMVVSGDSVTSTGASVSADGYDWSEIQTAAGTIGWVVSTYLTADSSDLLTSTGTVATVATDSLNLRDTPGLGGNSLATLATGDTVTIVSASEAADGHLWYQVQTASGNGWVAGEFLIV